MRDVACSKISYQPISHCSICDWCIEITDHRRMAREARKHCSETGHTVWIDWYTTSRYDYISS